MTTLVDQEIARIQTEAAEKIRQLEKAKNAAQVAQVAADALAQEASGLALKKRRRAAAVGWYETQARPQHEQAFAQIGDKVTDWQERFTQAVEALKAMGYEWGQLKEEYEAALEKLFDDILIALENDASIGIGYTTERYHEQIREISRAAGFSDNPLQSLDRQALELARVQHDKSAYAALFLQIMRGSQRESNLARLKKTIDAEVERS